MNGTIIQQGSFVGTGYTKNIRIRSDFDWVKVINYTNITGSTQWDAVEWFWMDGLDSTDTLVYYHAAASQALSVSTVGVGYNSKTFGGISKIDMSKDSAIGALYSTITAISTAATPVVTVSAWNNKLQNNAIVRLINVTNAQQLGGIDFTIGNCNPSAKTFELSYMSQLGVAGTTGSYRVLNFQGEFYPKTRYISAITKASQAVVTLTVTHDYEVGGYVRFNVPSAYGMTEINGQVGKIVAIDTTNNTITVDIDTTGYTTFAFPATTAVAFTPATVTPMGVEAGGTTDFATENFGGIYLSLESSGNNEGDPCGASSDTIYWMVGKSFNV